MPPADDRTYIKVHDGIEDHPKIAPLSDKGFRLLVTTWAWCARHLTDGRVPLAVWNRRGTKKTRDELVAGKLAEVRGEYVVMHDYLKHQRSAAEVTEKREAQRRGAMLGNHRRWHVDKGIRDVGCEFCLVGLPTDDRSVTDRPTENGAISRSDPESSLEVQVQEQKREKTSSTAPRSTRKQTDDPNFMKFWAVYPRKVGKGEARKAWAKVIKSGADPSRVIAGAERYRDDPQRRRKDIEYTKHPGPWLNAERWTDQLNGNDLRPAQTAWWEN